MYTHVGDLKHILSVYLILLAFVSWTKENNACSHVSNTHILIYANLCSTQEEKDCCLPFPPSDRKRKSNTFMLIAINSLADHKFKNT